MYQDQLKTFEKLAEQTKQVYDFWIDAITTSLKMFTK
jgi:hypothetical protein